MSIALNGETTASLRAAYEDFSKDPLETFRVALRRARAQQLRHLLHDPATVDLETFDKEVWRFESVVTIRGKSINGKIFPKHNAGHPTTQKSQSLTQKEIECYADALAQGDLEFHGNSIWRLNGTFAPTQSDAATRLAYLRQLLDALNDNTLTPYEKCLKMSGVKHCKEKTASGLVMVYHPTEFALYNDPSIEALRKTGLEVNSLATFAKSVASLRTVLDCPDYIELDWFLNLLWQGQYRLESSSAAQPVSELVSVGNSSIRSMQSDIVSPIPRFVHISAGIHAKYWDDCLKGNYICVGSEKWNGIKQGLWMALLMKRSSWQSI